MNSFFLTIALFFCVSVVSAQDFKSILSAVEHNNIQLKTAREANAAMMSDLRSENTLGTTSIEYSPFYAGGVNGLATSELVVSQDFDFPTLYSTRRRAGDRRQQVLDIQFQTLRRDVLLQANKLCIDVLYSDCMRDLLMQRLGVADTLLDIYMRRLENGDATQLDVNRIRMDRMNLQTELLRNQGDRHSHLISLQRLNGGLPVDSLWDSSSPSVMSPLELVTPLPQSTLEISLSEASLLESQQDVKVARQSMMPTLTLGYRRNTEYHDAFNGILVGASFPLFSASGKVRAARQRQNVASFQACDVVAEQQSQYASWQSEVAHLKAILQTYDTDLMQQTLRLLMKAVVGGEMSVVEYYTESDRIIVSLQEKLSVELRIRKLYADLQRESL